MDKKLELESRVKKLENFLKMKNEDSFREELVDACEDVYEGLVFLQAHTDSELISDMLDLLGEFMDESGIAVEEL